MPKLIRAFFTAMLLFVSGTGSGGQEPGLRTLSLMGPFLNGTLPTSLSEPGVEAPGLLSQVGAFKNLANLSVVEGLLPYEVNSPLWSDGAEKFRWIALPNNGRADSTGEKIAFSEMESWRFPVGTVLVKHFELRTDIRLPGKIRRLETRFLVHGNGGYYGLTYRWRPDGEDAELLSDGVTDSIDITSDGNFSHQQRWVYPSRSDCLNCHNERAGSVLGLRTHQLNRDTFYPTTERLANQLVTWNALGLFDPVLDPSSVSRLMKSSDIHDASRPLEERVRSYLDANCSHCHRPGNPAARFDARFTTPLALQGLIDGPALYDLGTDGARIVVARDSFRSMLYRRMSSTEAHRMPPVGRETLDNAALFAITEWITQLPLPGQGTRNQAPVARDDQSLVLAGETSTLQLLANDYDAEGDPLSVLSWSPAPRGRLLVTPDGHATYAAPPGFVGLVTFTYSIRDTADNLSPMATVQIRVVGPPDASRAVFEDRSELLSNPSACSGVALGASDMNRDGLDDIVHFHLGTQLRIDYQKAPGQPFRGLSIGARAQPQWGAAVGDVDNDGFPDIITGGYYDGLHLYRSINAGSSFVLKELREAAAFLQGISLADIDKDSQLDIFGCNDDSDSVKLRNMGKGNLQLAPNLVDTRTRIPSDNSGNYGCVWTDYDNDGDADLYLSKCRGVAQDPRDPRRVNMLLRNDPGGFTEVASEVGLDFGQQTWSADFGDIDNDGDLDCFVGNHEAPCVFLRQDNGRFADITALSGVNVDWRVIQTIFRDFNNDGWLDLLLTGEHHELWMNQGLGKFVLAADPFTAWPMESAVVGDFNHDGFSDLYASHARLYNAPSTDRPDKLFLSKPNGNAFLSVKLEGRKSNYSAAGARMEARGPWGIQVREVRCGESYGITHSPTQIFGLGQFSFVDLLSVRWPSGETDELRGLQASQFLVLKEGSSKPPILVNPGIQGHDIGDPVDLVLSASDPTNDPLSFSAKNLPQGVELDANSGRITGSPTSQGLYEVTISVSDAWNTVSQKFDWQIQDGHELELTSQYRRWLTRYASEEKRNEPLDDPDQDGASNLVEYALGGDPLRREPAGRFLPEVSWSGRQASLLYFLQENLGDTISVEPQSSEDLKSWRTWPSTNASISPINSELSRVRFPLPKEAIGQFWRLRIRAQ